MCFRRTSKRLDAIEANLALVLVEVTYLIELLDRKVDDIMADLMAIADSVTENTDVVASAVVLLDSLAAQLEAAATDPAQVAALADQIRANSAALAEAVARNTVAEPPVEEPVA